MYTICSLRNNWRLYLWVGFVSYIMLTMLDGLDVIDSFNPICRCPWLCVKLPFPGKLNFWTFIYEHEHVGCLLLLKGFSQVLITSVDISGSNLPQYWWNETVMNQCRFSREVGNINLSYWPGQNSNVVKPKLSCTCTCAQLKFGAQNILMLI